MVKFSESRVWDKVPEGSPVIFGDTQISLKHSVGQVEGSIRAEGSPIRPVFRYNAVL